MESTPDTGPGGFLSIFRGEKAPAAETPEPTAAQAETPAADTAAPEEAAPAADLSAEDVVAARFAALSAEQEDGTAPETEAETEAGDGPEHLLLGDPAGDLSLDALTPEQLRHLAEEAIRLRGEVTDSTRREAGQRVAAAEAAAVAQVQTAYEQNVLSVAERHYSQQFEQRLAALIPQVTEEQLPAAAAALAEQVNRARQEWVAEQEAAYEAHARQAALNARLAAPEFRQYAAEQLVAQAGLPSAAVAEVLKTPDTRQFEARVAELVAIRDALLAERARNQQQRRQDANAALRQTTPRTAPTGTLPGGKPPAYRGTAAEGAQLLAFIRNRS